MSTEDYRPSSRDLLTIFIDGLRPDSVAHMPFLSSLPHQRRLRTDLGYSITCHATMYSGVYPDRHHLWFVWKRSQRGGPFKWLRPLKLLPRMNLWPAHYAASKAFGHVAANSSWFGLPPIVHLPFAYWSDIDVSETRKWDEDGYLESVPTIFEILRSHGIEMEIVGMDNEADAKSERIAEHQFGARRPWTYIFIGDVDSLSHAYRQDSEIAAELLYALDRRLERLVERYERIGSDYDLLVYSDHGHIPVEHKIDLYQHFDRLGLRLNRYFHIIDANYARFWLRTDRERSDIERALRELPGFVLSQEHVRQYRVEMPDNRYGDLIFYLDRPNIFERTIWGFSRSQRSMHGYLPDYPDSDGVVLSTRELDGDRPVSLADILPTHLAALNLPIPSHVEGLPRLAVPRELDRPAITLD